MKLRYLVALVVSLFVLGGSLSAQAPQWPANIAKYKLSLYKTAGLEMTDPWLAHLGAGADHHDAASVDLGIFVTQAMAPGGNGALEPNGNATRLPLEMFPIDVQYTVHGVPVSPWLPAPFAFTLRIDNPALGAVPCGYHDVSVDVRGMGKADYFPAPMELHLDRGGCDDTFSKLVPIWTRDCQYCDSGAGGNGGANWGARVTYVELPEAPLRGHPLDPTVTAWHQPTWSNADDLYLELLAPHTEQFYGEQMKWKDPYGGRTYVRALVPKFGEDIRSLRVGEHQNRLPCIDGPRGVAWASGYIGGEIAADGTMWFAEKGCGSLRTMAPDGTVTTLAGWRVKPGRLPVHPSHELAAVRTEQEFVGDWVEGLRPGDALEPGFRTPTDVALDPQNPGVAFVSGFEDHTIWRVDTRVSPARVTVFAGDPGHAPGFVDAAGHAARFNSPISIVWNLAGTKLYVADQDNDAVRVVDRDGAVTTLFGRPGMDARLRALGAGVGAGDAWQLHADNRLKANYVVTPAQAAAGVEVDTMLPQTVRIDSQDRLYLLDFFGGIRRIDQVDGRISSVHRQSVDQRWERNDEANSSRGWAWFAIDRWGNSGPLDSIYFLAFQMSSVTGAPGARTNEAYGAIDAADLPDHGHFIFEDLTDYPDGFGLLKKADPPHYGWMVFIDPRGRIVYTGGAEHGAVAIRKRRSSDAVPSNYPAFLRAKWMWQNGWGPYLHRPAPVQKFGPGGHNRLGFADTWDHKNDTDAQLIAAFEIPVADATPQELADLLMFLRVNGGYAGFSTTTIPTPTPTPTPPPVKTTSPNGTVGPAITDCRGGAWTLTPDLMTERDGTHMGGGYGTKYKLQSCVANVLGKDAIWYAWTWRAAPMEDKGDWKPIGATEPGGIGSAGTPDPIPVPPASPCVVTPIVVSKVTWPTLTINKASGGTFTASGPAPIVSATWKKSPAELVVTDARGCAASVKK